MVTQSLIQSNLIYEFASANPSWFGIIMTDTWDTIIAQNVLQSWNVASAKTGIQLSGAATANVIISKNILRGDAGIPMNSGIVIGAGANGVVIDEDNLFINVTTRINDAGTGTYKKKRRYEDTILANLVAAITQTINMALPANYFTAKPSTVVVQHADAASHAQTYVCTYDYSAGGNSATNIVVRVDTIDGAAATVGTKRFSVIAVE